MAAAPPCLWPFVCPHMLVILDLHASVTSTNASARCEHERSRACFEQQCSAQNRGTALGSTALLRTEALLWPALLFAEQRHCSGQHCSAQNRGTGVCWA